MGTKFFPTQEQAEIHADLMEARGLEVQIITRDGGYAVVRLERDLREGY
jgi:ribosomal protein L2